jgi:uncharacterized protein
MAITEASRRRPSASIGATLARAVPRLAPLVLLALVSSAACTEPETPSVTIHLSPERSVTVRVEIADSPEERALGLMYRTSLEPDAGMLFLFPDESERSFWMKNTPLPLDIVFLSSAGVIVGIAERTTPFSLDPIPSGAPARRVLEVAAGFVAQHGLRVGQTASYRGVPDQP